MADETPTIDLTKAAAGAWHKDDLQSMPVDTFKDRLLARAGVPETDDLRKDLNAIHPNETLSVLRLPDEIDIDAYTGPLSSVQDWLGYIATLDTSERVREATAGPLTPKPLDTERQLTAELTAGNAAFSANMATITPQNLGERVVEDKLFDDAPPPGPAQEHQE